MSGSRRTLARRWARRALVLAAVAAASIPAFATSAFSAPPAARIGTNALV